jgi:hypothetical protein
MEKFEEFVRKNREDLDQYSPSSDIWKRIRKDLYKSRFQLLRWISAAAVIVIIFTTAALFYIGENRKNYLNNRIASDALHLETEIMLKEAEIYYNNLINDLYSQASGLLTGYPDVKQELINDLSHLDSIYADIKEDLQDNLDNQEVIEALIINYRIKIDILENMLAILKQSSNVTEKNNSHAL